MSALVCETEQWKTQEVVPGTVVLNKNGAKVRKVTDFSESFGIKVYVE